MTKKKDILSIRDLTKEDIFFILETAASLKEILDRPIKKVPPLRGKTMVHLFFEPSTRTKLSFELAAKRLSADTVGISKSSSSVTKGEDLIDTAKNIEAMRPDVLVLRHPCSGAAHLMAKAVNCSVINAGDGTNEHPTQALLDMFTVKEHFGTLEGLKIAIIGDILHSRVAHSDMIGFTKMGSEVVICGPGTLMPPSPEVYGVKVKYNLLETIKDADVVMALRLQKERQGTHLIPSNREYASIFGINAEVLEKTKPEAIIMHPGPINRGIEMSPDVADSGRSLILDQVTNGVAVRMALLSILMAETGGQRQ